MAGDPAGLARAARVGAVTAYATARLFQNSAEAALRLGRAALAHGDLAAARATLERACRLAPADDAAALELALLRLRQGESGPAVASLAAIAGRLDAREAWLALAAGLLAQQRPREAAAALAAALSGHVLPEPPLIAPLADAVAGAVAAPGWCGVDRDHRLVVSGAAPRVLIDGREVAWRRHMVVPRDAVRIEISLGGVPLLASPLAPARLRRLAGVVAAAGGGLAGWAWYPGDPDRDPRLSIVALTGGRTLGLIASDREVAQQGPLSRPRGFAVSAAVLARFGGPVRVLGEDGQELDGSPLDPGAPARAARAVAAAIARRVPLSGRAEAANGLELAPMPAGPIGPPARAPLVPERPVAVVVVAGDPAGLAACLDAVRASVPAGSEVLVVDDATADPVLAALLAGLGRQGLRVLRHARKLGLVAAANAGLRAAARLPGGRDVVLLQCGALVTPGWLGRLRAAVHAAPDIGSAAPLSNHGALMRQPGPAPDRAALARFDGLALDLPTAAGPCLYLRRECLRATGLPRAGLFAPGRGAMEDFGLRARHLGWRHAGVPGAYVAAADGAATAADDALLERHHPGYLRLLAAFERADPLAGPRRVLDTARWKAGRAQAGAVLLVSHDGGGGVERALAARCAAIRAEGRRPIVLRPVVLDPALSEAADGRRYAEGWCVLGDGVGGGFPGLRFRLPDELGALARLLRAERPVALEVHHLLGHHHAVTGLAARLGIPADWHVHDYAAFCPRITLIGPGGRYCGEPERVEQCEACIADCGAAIEEPIGVAALRARSAADFAAARRVVVPCEDVAARLRRHFPAVRPVVATLEDDRSLPPLVARPPRARRLVCVVGAIGPAKGYDVLLDCARDARWRDMPLEFVLAGHSTDDARLIASGRVSITGPYREAEAEALVRGLAADLAWLPSIWPETWCYTLGTAWRAGLGVAAFDIGAPAERIRRTGRGWLLPLGLPPAAVNNALLAVNSATGDV